MYGFPITPWVVVQDPDNRNMRLQNFSLSISGPDAAVFRMDPWTGQLFVEVRAG